MHCEIQHLIVFTNRRSVKKTRHYGFLEGLASICGLFEDECKAWVLMAPYAAVSFSSVTTAMASP